MLIIPISQDHNITNKRISLGFDSINTHVLNNLFKIFRRIVGVFPCPSIYKQTESECNLISLIVVWKDPLLVTVEVKFLIFRMPHGGKEWIMVSLHCCNESVSISLILICLDNFHVLSQVWIFEKCVCTNSE